MASINWGRVRQGVEREAGRMVWRPYGLPEIVDLEHTALHDGVISTPWEIPEKMFVAVGVTGALFTRSANPNQPTTTEEILSEARACLDAGASTVHIHVRDDNGYNALDVDRFLAVTEPLRDEYPGLAPDGCLVPALDGEWEAMRRALEEKVFDAVPINATATYLGDSLFAMPAPMMMEQTRLVQESGAKPIIACYTDADVSNADRYLFRSGLISSPSYWGVLPALPGCSPMNNPRQMIEGLVRIVSAIYEVDADAVIYVCSAGRASTYLVTLAAMLGLHIRVGMEDTLWMWPHKDDMLKSNTQHLELAKEIALVTGREIATRSEYREIVGLS